MHTDRADRITQTLAHAFAPARLEVRDDSHKHAGHQGAQSGGQTHYHVTLVTDHFTGLNRVARTRAVNAALADEFATGLHALSLTLRAPGDPG